MKILDFSSNPELYDIIYESLCATDLPISGGQTRTIKRIFNKFESIGKPDDKHLFHITVDFPVVSLEDMEFELLVAAFMNVKWNAIGARKAAGAYEFLLSIAERTNGE